MNHWIRVPACWRVGSALAAALLAGCAGAPSLQLADGSKVGSPVVLGANTEELHQVCTARLAAKAIADVRECIASEQRDMIARARECEANRATWQTRGMSTAQVQAARAQCWRGGKDFARTLAAYNAFHELRAAATPTQLAAFINRHEHNDSLNLVPEAQARLAPSCQAPAAAVRGAGELQAWLDVYRRAAGPVCGAAVASVRTRLQGAEFDALQAQPSVAGWRAHVEKYQMGGDAPGVAQAREQLSAAVAHQQAQDIAGCTTEAACEAFVNRYASEDPAQLIPRAKAQLAEMKVQREVKDRQAAFDAIRTQAAAEAFIRQHGAADDGLRAKAQALAVQLARQDYRAAFNAIANATAAQAFISQYESKDPDKLVAGARGKLAEYNKQAQVQEFEAIASVVAAQAHIDKYAAADGAGTVARVRTRLAELKADERKAELERERVASERRAQVEKMVGSFVSWREALQVDSTDCVGILFIKKCLYVTYQFELRGKVEDFDAGKNQYVLRPVEVKLVTPSAVSMKYVEMRSQAVRSANERWMGATVTKPVSQFLN